MTVQAFEVGGCVRDRLLGLKPKDIDFTVTAESFEEMRRFVTGAGLKIVVDRPEYATIRAVGNFRGHSGGLDFVWARIDGPYTDGRRPDWTRPGTLLDDLRRRDFTVNAMAVDASRELIDPFGGQTDLGQMLLRAVGDADERIAEDPLRMLRALRFRIVKGFRLHDDLRRAMIKHGDAICTVSPERIREELNQMLKFDTFGTLMILGQFAALERNIFDRGLRLEATLKE